MQPINIERFKYDKSCLTVKECNEFKCQRVLSCRLIIPILRKWITIFAYLTWLFHWINLKYMAIVWVYPTRLRNEVGQFPTVWPLFCHPEPFTAQFNRFHQILNTHRWIQSFQFCVWQFLHFHPLWESLQCSRIEVISYRYVPQIIFYLLFSYYSL